MINKSEFWSIAHVRQDILLESLSYTKASLSSDHGWMQYLATETPNGALLQKNVLFDIARSHKVYLAHVTKSFSAIKETGKIFSSSGCLVGSIYCTPIIQEGKKLRLHNLGEYILTKESPKFSRQRKDVALLLIELDLPRSSGNVPLGIDYLRLGPVHFSVFSELNYLLSHNELEDLKRSAIGAIRKTAHLFAIIEEFPPQLIADNFGRFYASYQRAISELPILGYFLTSVALIFYPHVDGLMFTVMI